MPTRRISRSSEGSSLVEEGAGEEVGERGGGGGVGEGEMREKVYS